MTRFVAGFADELEKLATDPGQSDLTLQQKREDGVEDPTSHYRPKIRSGTLGPYSGGPLLADPSKYPNDRLAP